MVRRAVYHSGGKPTDVDPSAVAFSERLNHFMLAKGWRQSDLARAIVTVAPKGYSFSRGSVSSWHTGRNKPSGVNLVYVAKALGVKVTDLVPEGTVITTQPQPIKMTLNTDNTARLVFDASVPADIALKITALLNEANARK